MLYNGGNYNQREKNNIWVYVRKRAVFLKKLKNSFGEREEMKGESLKEEKQNNS